MPTHDLSEIQAETLRDAQRRASRTQQKAQKARAHLQDVYRLIADAEGIEAEPTEVQLEGDTLVIQTDED